MEAHGVHRKLTAILSADVVGYSRLMAEDDIATVRMLTEHRGLMKILVEGYRGRVVDSPGDNVLAEFPSVVDAVECAVVIQKELKAQNDRLAPSRQMQFRIGINLGDVIVDGDKIYGDGVNIAARLEGLADAGGICISGSAYDQIENKLPLGYESLGPQTVKNFSKPVRVYRAVTSVEPARDETDLEPSAARVEPLATVPPVAAILGEAHVSSSSRRRAVLVAGVLVALGAIGGIATWRLTSPAATTAAVPPVVRPPSPEPGPAPAVTQPAPARPPGNPAVTQPAPARSTGTAVDRPATRPPRTNIEARPTAPRESAAAKPGAEPRDDKQRAAPPSAAGPATAPRDDTPRAAPAQREIPQQAN